MNTHGDILVIEDDIDDRFLLNMVYQELGYPNKLVFFEDGIDAYNYLLQDDSFPFLILCDVNMPKLNGFDLKKMIHKQDKLSIKCIPYLFFSTHTSVESVTEAYSSCAQGFFSKPSDYDKLKHTLKVILEYWTECYAPRRFKELASQLQ
jgi:DNA-binding NtrC family response regulator